MSTKSRTHGIRLKIERAKEHIRDLDIAIQGFIADKPYRLGAKPHAAIPWLQMTLYIAEIKPIPSRISLIVGDTIHNLRSALDHLMWQLVEAAGGKPDRNIYFPVSDGAHQYASMMGNGEIQKISKDARDIIEAIQPYVTLDQTLWLLHYLDIVDKHRLVLTIAATMDKWGLEFFKGQTTWFSEYRFMPLVVGQEIVNFPVDKYQEAQEKFQLGLDIAFGESEVPEGELVLYTLKKMVDFVEGFVSKFDRFLS
jgi:hypothetical protein